MGLVRCDPQRPLECELRLADATHAVERGGHDNGGAAPFQQCLANLGEHRARIVKMRAQAVIEGVKWLRLARWCTKCGLGTPGTAASSVRMATKA